MDIGIIGCGFIGSTIAAAADHMDEINKIYLYDRSPYATRELRSKIRKGVDVETVDELINKSVLVIEAASQEAVKQYGAKILEKGRDLMILSVGALVDESLWQRFMEIKKKSGARIYIPSGAIAGLDGVGAAVSSNINTVELVTTKPPEGFRGVKYLDERGIDLNSIEEPVVIFQGTAKEAVKLFPKNINVAATLSLAALGFDKTRVKIIIDPRTTRNTHEIIVKGRFGELHCKVENVPSITNPKTSYLASLAGINLLKKIVTGVWIG